MIARNVWYRTMQFIIETLVNIPAMTHCGKYGSAKDMGGGPG
jgi:hypothetical protein